MNLLIYNASIFTELQSGGNLNFSQNLSFFFCLSHFFSKYQESWDRSPFSPVTSHALLWISIVRKPAEPFFFPKHLVMKSILTLP